MRKIALYIVFVCLFVSSSLATYTYEIYTYSSNIVLDGNESVLVADEGGMDSLNLDSQSSATIIGTSLLGDGTGGIWHISMAANSSLDFQNGEVHLLSLHNDATATLTGGLIESIYSYQNTTTTEGDPPQEVPNPHITLYYSGDIPAVQEINSFNYLVGNWGDGTGFSIYLHDTGYDAYANFDFILIPEPATLLLIGLGGFLIRRKK